MRVTAVTRTYVCLVGSLCDVAGVNPNAVSLWDFFTQVAAVHTTAVHQLSVNAPGRALRTHPVPQSYLVLLHERFAAMYSGYL